MVPAPPDSAIRKILVPREHGSWGIWLVPLVSGALIGAKGASAGASLPVIWFLIASASAYLSYQPLEVLLGLSPLRVRTSREHNVALAWILSCLLLGSVSLVELVRLGRMKIIWFAVLGGACFAIRWLFGKTRAYRTSKQVMGALALTSTAAGSYYVAGGTINKTALLLWLAYWLFSAAQIEFVQLCIRTSSAKSSHQKFLAGRTVLAFHILLLLAAVAVSFGGLAPALFCAAFVPALMRVVLWVREAPRKINFRSLGFAELFQNLLFAAITTIAFVLR